MTDDSIDIVDLANAVADEHDAVVLLYSGSIDNAGFGRLLSELQPSEMRPYRPNVVLILTTNGGDANAAYRIARTLQRTFEKFLIYVPAYCKSAGSLIALGASELVMEHVSELGPLDVQLLQQDEIGQRRSGLVVRTAFEGLATETFDVFEHIMMNIKLKSAGVVSFETASRIASSISASVMSPVYAQISPDALGNDLRDLHVATQYGVRLAHYGGNVNSGTVEHMVSGYPSHDFIIDFQEAEQLFETVSLPNENLENLTNAIGPLVYSEHDPHVVGRLDETKGEDGDHDDNDGSTEKSGGAPVAARRRKKGPSDSEGK